MADKIGWGLMGAGRIVERWIKGARQVPDLEIRAVASRTENTAAKTAQAHGITDVETYESLVQRPDIDVVYIAVPHPAHAQLAMLAMDNGKAVLVEKPATVNGSELQAVMECARRNQVFFMEAVWTRFFPLLDDIRELLGGDGIGDPRFIQSSFGFRVPDSALQDRILNPDLAGGSLLDVGVYNLHFFDMIFNEEPLHITGFCTVKSDDCCIEVDEQAAYLLQYSGGRIASAASAVRTDLRDTAIVYGTNGHLEIPVFWKPTIMYSHIGGQRRVHRRPVPARSESGSDEGFQYEVAHVNDCLRRGLRQSPIMSWERSRRIMSQCDTLRAQWKLHYPFEK